MHLSRRSVAFAAALAIALIGTRPSVVVAQLYVAVGATANFTSMGSGEFEFPGAGFGIAGQARVGRGWVSVGVGGMAMNFPIEAQSGNVDLTGVFIEPRLTIEGIDPDGQFTPYAFARAAWASQEGVIDGTPLTGEARVIGGGAGGLLRVTPRISIDFGGSFSTVKLTERTFDSDPRPDESGGGFGAHIGAYLRFGGQAEVIELDRATERSRSRRRESARRPG